MQPSPHSWVRLHESRSQGLSVCGEPSRVGKPRLVGPRARLDSDDARIGMSTSTSSCTSAVSLPGQGRKIRPAYWTSRPENEIGAARNRVSGGGQSKPSPTSDRSRQPAAVCRCLGRPRRRKKPLPMAGASFVNRGEWRWRESNPRPSLAIRVFSGRSPLCFSRPRQSRGLAVDGPSHCLMSCVTP